MRIAAIVVGAVFILTAPAAQAARVTGKVIVTAEFYEALSETERKKAESERMYYWNEPNGITAVRPPMVDLSSDIAMVLIRSDAPEPKPDELTTVKLHAGAMERQVIVTRPGSTIRFRNVDPFDHELYSPGIASFRPEYQSNGSFRPVEFTQEGVYEIKCKIVPHFKAYVLVTKATMIVPVKRDGTFLVNNVEPGEYTLKILFKGKWIHKESFKLAGGAGPKLEIKLKIEGSDKPKAKAEKTNTEAAGKAK